MGEQAACGLVACPVFPIENPSWDQRRRRELGLEITDDVSVIGKR